MAVDLFLKINGVKGDSKNKAHFKEIDCPHLVIAGAE